MSADRVARLHRLIAGTSPSEAQEEKLRTQKKPIQRKFGLLDLASGDTTTVDAVEGFAFNASGTHLALRRYPPERPGAPAEAPVSDDAGVPGATLIVRELATGRDTTFGNVSEYAWQDKGKHLAFAINADDKTGNGIHLYDPSDRIAARPRLRLRRVYRARLAPRRGRSRRPSREDGREA